MSIQLRGIDAERFLENLNKELTQDEINEIRAWACAPKVKEIEKQLDINEKAKTLIDYKIECLILSRKLLQSIDDNNDSRNQFMIDIAKIPKDKRLQLIKEIEVEIPKLLEVKRLCDKK